MRGGIVSLARAELLNAMFQVLAIALRAGVANWVMVRLPRRRQRHFHFGAVPVDRPTIWH